MVGHHLPPDALWALVCTDPDGKRHENLSWLHIPANLPGITIQHMHLMMGIKNAVFFDNVRVPAKYLIGGENNGWKVANTHLELEHGGDGRVGTDPVVDRVVEYCQNHDVGGKPLIEDPHVRDTIADMIMEINTVNRMARRIFWHRFVKEPHAYGGAQFRYYQRMVRLRNGERLQKIMGADALIRITASTRWWTSSTSSGAAPASFTAAAPWIPIALSSPAGPASAATPRRRRRIPFRTVLTD